MGKEGSKAQGLASADTEGLPQRRTRRDPGKAETGPDSPRVGMQVGCLVRRAATSKGSLACLGVPNKCFCSALASTLAWPRHPDSATLGGTSC